MIVRDIRETVFYKFDAILKTFRKNQGLKQVYWDLSPVRKVLAGNFEKL